MNARPPLLGAADGAGNLSAVPAGEWRAGADHYAAVPARRKARRVALGAVLGFYLGDALSNVLPLIPAYAQMIAGAVLGLVLDRLADRRPGLAAPVLGAALGALVGYIICCVDLYASSGYAASHDGGYAGGTGSFPLVGLASGAAYGLAVGLLVNRLPRLAIPTLGLGLGTLAGYTASAVLAAGSGYQAVAEPASGFASNSTNVFLFVTGAQPIVYVAAGAAVGLILGLVVNHWPRLTTPALGLAIGILAGHLAGSAVRLDRVYLSGYDMTTVNAAYVSSRGAIVLPVAGALIGLSAGLLADHRPRLAIPALGLVLGAAIGFLAGDLYSVVYKLSQPGFLANEDFLEGFGYRPAACMAMITALGLGLGLLADRHPRVKGPLLGLALGVLVGLSSPFPGSLLGSAYPGELAVAGGAAVLGLAVGLLTNHWPRLGNAALGLTLGSLAGSAAGISYWSDWALASDPYRYVGVGTAAGAMFGLVVGLPADRHRVVSRLCLGAFAGAFSTGPAFITMPAYQPDVPAFVKLAVGVLLGTAVAARRNAVTWGSLPVRRAVARTVPPAGPILRLLRPATFTHGLVGLAAAIGASRTERDRYAEEFDATLAGITGRLARVRRLWCALSILASAALLRAELARKPRNRS